MYVFHDFHASKTTQLIRRSVIYNTLKTLLILYTFGVVVSVFSGLTFFKKKAKGGELSKLL